MNNTRKLLSLICAVLMLLALTACGPGSTDPDDSPQPSEDIVDPADPTESPEPTPEETETPEPSDTPEPPTPSPSQPAETPDAGGGQESGSDVDLTAFYDTIVSTYDFMGMTDYDSAMLDGYYAGLSEIATKQLIVRAPMITFSSVEIALIECENSEDVETVIGILEARIQAQVDGGAWYPASIEIWKGAQVVSNGNFVMMICSDGSTQEIADSFAALFA